MTDVLPKDDDVVLVIQAFACMEEDAPDLICFKRYYKDVKNRTVLKRMLNEDNVYCTESLSNITPTWCIEVISYYGSYTDIKIEDPRKL